MDNIPKHVAIILDGNGRWAKKRMMPRTYGHIQGSKNVENICKAADELGIKYLTFYAFSTENWKRPKEEVDELMRLLSSYLRDSLSLSKKNNMRIRVIGDTSILPAEFVEDIKKVVEASKEYTGLNMTIALNYGGRDEITRAVKKMIANQISEGKSASELIDSIDEAAISACLDTADIPDPDLMIRTSGEQRLSNYLLWQMAYTEFYFTDVLWPDFSKEDLKKALEYYATRDRRFGNAK